MTNRLVVLTKYTESWSHCTTFMAKAGLFPVLTSVHQSGQLVKRLTMESLRSDIAAPASGKNSLTASTRGSDLSPDRMTGRQRGARKPTFIDEELDDLMKTLAGKPGSRLLQCRRSIDVAGISYPVSSGDQPVLHSAAVSSTPRISPCDHLAIVPHCGKGTARSMDAVQVG